MSLQVQYSTVQYSTVQYSTVQYSTVKYSTVVRCRCGLDEDDLESLSNSSEAELEEVVPPAEAVEAISLNSDQRRGEAEAGPRSQRVAGLVRVAASPVKEHSPAPTLENTLQQEFALLETNLTFVQIVERDLERRTCRVIANTGHSRLLVSISFPPSYPANTAPVFTFLKGSTLIQQNRTKILKLLQDSALAQVIGRRVVT